MDEWNQDFTNGLVSFNDFNDLCNQLDNWVERNCDEYIEDSWDIEYGIDQY